MFPKCGPCRGTGGLWIWGQLVNRLGWYIEKGKEWIPAYAESTPRLEQKGSGKQRTKGWVPAFAESTPRIEQKSSGGNDEAQRK